MCLHVRFQTPLHAGPDFHRPPQKPESHLALVVGGLRSEREIVDALLRVDLGARINVDAKAGRVRIEGRFWREDIVTAIERLGCSLDGIEERPRSRPEVRRPAKSSARVDLPPGATRKLQVGARIGMKRNEDDRRGHDVQPLHSSHHKSGSTAGRYG